MQKRRAKAEGARPRSVEMLRREGKRWKRGIVCIA